MKKIPPHISLEEMDEKQLQDALMIGWNEFKAGKTVSAKEAFVKFNKAHKNKQWPSGRPDDGDDEKLTLSPNRLQAQNLKGLIS